MDLKCTFSSLAVLVHILVISGTTGKARIPKTQGEREEVKGEERKDQQQQLILTLLTKCQTLFLAVNVNSLSIHGKPAGWYHNCPHCMDKKTEVQTGEYVICPRLPSTEVPEPGCTPRHEGCALVTTAARPKEKIEPTQRPQSLKWTKGGKKQAHCPSLKSPTEFKYTLRLTCCNQNASFYTNSVLQIIRFQKAHRDHEQDSPEVAQKKRTTA